METYLLLAQMATSRRDGTLAFSAVPDAPVLTGDPTGPVGRFVRRLRRSRLWSAGRVHPRPTLSRPALPRRHGRVEVPT